MTVDATFRCSRVDPDDPDPMAGSAPTDAEWLLVEYAGPWGRQAVAESRLPDAVRAHLDGLAGVRVQLIRRHGGESGPGVRVFSATLGVTPAVRTAVLLDVADLLGQVTWEAYDEPLWLVCTNGRRDVCCAELGRPVASALAARWPEETWETTHLGGHRFSGTLLALPSGVTLGRLDAESAVHAVSELAAGRFPVAQARGRAGVPGAAQVAELHLRAELGVADVSVVSVDGGDVVLRAGGERYDVRVEVAMSEPRRQSCADLKTKPAPVFRVESVSRR